MLHLPNSDNDLSNVERFSANVAAGNDQDDAEDPHVDMVGSGVGGDITKDVDIGNENLLILREAKEEVSYVPSLDVWAVQPSVSSPVYDRKILGMRRDSTLECVISLLPEPARVQAASAILAAPPSVLRVSPYPSKCPHPNDFHSYSETLPETSTFIPAPLPLLDLEFTRVPLPPVFPPIPVESPTSTTFKGNGFREYELRVNVWKLTIVVKVGWVE
ncbi:hypothetical protein BDQ12DRAFT_726092 [Crucibulum laeve]|uniref:Uncharacterized protein n=1 Tax=Crucibulum laeve TaxID=68775 RepID=A0A5C3LRV7_9AGAR|nr:hypothetical protein BDQ12DRAFT_726092 [Crucibulum laeve]